jgi:anion-transporting  ArsA/GET3 family ATPase
MASILTFLGKGGTGRTTVAIATAQKLASLGARVLFVEQDPSPIPALLLGSELSTTVGEIAPNLKAVQLSATLLLEQGWNQVKDLEAQYLRSPTLKNVFGQELGILPGIDEALALNALREYDQSGHYDVIIYDGSGDLSTLRMFGIPEVLDWYIRRFRKVLEDSDIVKALSPFIGPVTSTILTVSWSGDDFSQQSTNQAKDLLAQGKQAIADPQRVAAYLVTTDDPFAIANAQYLWGSAQQIGLNVKGAILTQGGSLERVKPEFDPLEVWALPKQLPGDWQSLRDALPDLRSSTAAPLPIAVDLAARQVKVFLPSFDKKQVKLTQYGPEVTIDAGNQRHNLDLPAALRGQPIQGAKFQSHYLIISF